MKMTAETICIHHKYGHCKFSFTCRHHHVKDICFEKLCEITNCNRRHPKPCKYFDQYQRCKFGEFCSFSHEIRTHESDDITNMKEKLSKFENDISERDLEIDILKEKLRNVEEKLDKTLESIKTVIDIVVKEALDVFTKTVAKQQDEAEKRSETIFKTFQNQISSITDLLRTSTNNLSSSHPGYPPVRVEHQPLQLDHAKNHETSPQPTQSRYQCDLCGKSFGSDRALKNHARKDHKPNP